MADPLDREAELQRRSYDDDVDDILRAYDAYVDPIARFLPRDSALFDALCATLERCGERWSAEEFVPRILANLCVELPWMIENLGHGYGGEEGDRIGEEAARLEELSADVILPWPKDRPVPIPQ